jgi:MYXO-CTERM domain-containing protein
MVRVRGITAAMLASALSLVSQDARALPIVAEPCSELATACMRAPINFEMSDELLPVQWDIDTGWVPSGSPLQVRLQTLLQAWTRLALAGSLEVAWPHEDQIATAHITAPGDPMGGLLAYHYGLLVAAEAKIQIGVGPLNFNWQGDIPYVPQVDFQVQDQEVFDAWGWDPGAHAVSSTMPQQIAKVNIAGLVGPSIPGIEGGFLLDVAVDLDVHWTNDAIVIGDEYGDAVAGGAIVSAGGHSHEVEIGGSHVLLEVNPEGTLSYDGVLHLIPTFYVELLGNQWAIPVADIPIPFAIDEEKWFFEPQRVYVPLPDLVVEEEVIDLGVVPLGEESFVYYHLSNVGEARAAMSMKVSDPDNFPLWDEALSIDPENAELASLRFTPKTIGLHEAEITIESNDPDAPITVVKVWGVGIAPHLIQPPADNNNSVFADSGCGCGVATKDGEPAWLWLLAAGLLLVRRREGCA